MSEEIDTRLCLAKKKFTLASYIACYIQAGFSLIVGILCVYFALKIDADASGNALLIIAYTALGLVSLILFWSILVLGLLYGDRYRNGNEDRVYAALIREEGEYRIVLFEFENRSAAASSSKSYPIGELEDIRVSKLRYRVINALTGWTLPCADLTLIFKDGSHALLPYIYDGANISKELLAFKAKVD